MSAEKLQSIHAALAEVFTASNPNAVGTDSSHGTFDHGILSEAFSEAHAKNTATNGSPAHFDHATLTGIFREPPTPMQTGFDQAFAEILSEPSTIAVDTKPSQPTFDHQALAEMLTEARADPIDPPVSSLSFDTESLSSSELSSDRTRQAEPMIQAVMSSAAETARPPRAKSLLAKLHQILSSGGEPVLSDAHRDTIPLSLPGRSSTAEPTAATTAPSATAALPQTRLLAEPSPFNLAQEPKSAQPSIRTRNFVPAQSDVAVTSPTGAGIVASLQAVSPPNEIPCPILIKAGTPLPSLENKSSPSNADGRAGSAATDIQPDAAPSLLEAENERLKQVTLLLVDPASTISNVRDPPSSLFANGHPDSTLHGQPNVEDVKPAATSYLERAQSFLPGVAPASGEVMQSKAARSLHEERPHLALTESSLGLQTGSPRSNLSGAAMSPPETKRPNEILSPELAKIESVELPASCVFSESRAPSSLSGQPYNGLLSVKRVGAADAAEPEVGPPQHLNSFLATLRVLSAKQEPPALETQPSRPTPGDQPDRAGTPAKAVVDPTVSESTVAQRTKSLPSEMPAPLPAHHGSSPPTLGKLLSSLPLSNHPPEIEPTAKVVAPTAPADSESAVTRAQQAKLLLAELDLHTAIRLRWVMRDIKNERTKLSPVSADDLTALVNLGFVKLRDGLPRLTDLGILALD